LYEAKNEASDFGVAGRGLGVFCFFLQAKPAEAYSNGDLVSASSNYLARSGWNWRTLQVPISIWLLLHLELESMQVGPGGTIVNNLPLGIVPARGLLVISG